MMFLASVHFGWLIGAAFLGLVVGWIAVVRHGEGASVGAMRVVLGMIAVLLIVALARVLPGRLGYWLDLGLLLGLCYIVGCTIGSWLRERVLAKASQSAADLQ